MKPFLLAIIVSGCVSYAQAQVVLTDNTDGATVAGMYHLRTTDPQLDILGVSRLNFNFLDTKSVSLGYDRDIHWFRFDVENRSSRTDWFLEVAFPLLDHIEFYSADASGNWSLQYSGDMYKMSTRAVRHKNFVFPFAIKPDTREAIYLKIVSTSAVQVPVTIWSPEGLRDDGYEQQFAHGLFYGLMLIMIFYHLFLYLSVRDKSMLYYVLTLIAATNVITYYNGYGFYFFNPEWPELNRIVAAFASPLFIVASVALTRSFLALKTINFWLDRTLMAIAAVAVIFALLAIGLEDYISYLPMRLLALVNFTTILISAIYCFRRYRPARYFLLAWGTILVLGILLLLRNVGVIGDIWLVDHGLYVGGALQTLLISFAFGDRFNILQRENLLAKERELMREHEEKERLEREVHLRTEELRQKNSELEESNNIKNKLFSIVSHDLRGPLISLQGILDMVDMDTLSPEELKKFIKKIGGRLDVTAEFLDNLLQWSRMQIQGDQFHPNREAFLLHQLLVTSTQVLRADSERKNIHLTIEDSPDLQVYADMNMIQTVVRNLVSNAIKFTHPGGKVGLSAFRKNGSIAVRVSDTGTGIPEGNIEKLFTLHGVSVTGTQLEKGTGIGLAVCKEFVERNGGTISVQSTINVGTAFEFTIPLASGS
ncbi:MAG TPA: sensor histidine kinase [Cyclobacteriaceae bacterium]|nr:sensor histidine kinase [Cyclobacteriaceae bacterium]